MIVGGGREVVFKKIVVGILIVGLLLCGIYGYAFFVGDNAISWTYVSNKSLVWINLIDQDTEKPIEAPVVSVVPELSLIASPGTETDGPYLYKLLFPIPAVITARATGYKTRNAITFLRVGHVGTIKIKKV